MSDFATWPSQPAVVADAACAATTGSLGQAARDIVALNAGASIYIAGLGATLAEGVTTALAVIASGAARRKLDEFVGFTTSNG